MLGFCKRFWDTRLCLGRWGESFTEEDITKKYKQTRREGRGQQVTSRGCIRTRSCESSKCLKMSLDTMALQGVLNARLLPINLRGRKESMHMGLSLWTKCSHWKWLDMTRIHGKENTGWSCGEVEWGRQEALASVRGREPRRPEPRLGNRRDSFARNVWSLENRIIE